MIVLESKPGVGIQSEGDRKPSMLRTWTAREGLEAELSRDGESLIAKSSGSPGCFGGWDIVFPVEGGTWYSVGLSYRAEEMESVLDGLPLFVFWEDDDGERVDYDYLIIHEPASEGRAQRTFRCPDDATNCVLRIGVRWTTTGRAEFWLPKVTPTDPPPSRIHRIAVAAERPKSPESVGDNVRQYVQLAEDAADFKPDLVPVSYTHLTLPTN